MKDPKLYTDVYQLTVFVFHKTKGFPKQLRPTVGRNLEEKVLELSFVVRKATVHSGKIRIKYLKISSSFLDEVKILGQLASDLKGFSVGSYHDFSKLTAEIGREIGGFLKHEKRD